MSTTHNEDRRRNQALDLLEQGIQAKLLYGGQAETLLREALKIATTPTPCSAPVVALAHFRLAMLLARNAATVHELTTVEQLFAEGQRSPALAVRAAAFRLVALGRLRSANPGLAWHEKTERQITQLVALAARQESPRSARLEASLANEQTMQGEAANLLELAAFSVGAAGPLTAGLSLLPTAWRERNTRLLGPARSENRTTSWDFAEEHIRGIAAAGTATLLFLVPKSGTTADYWSSHSGWSTFPVAHGRLLGAMLDSPLAGPDLVRAVMGSARQITGFRQALTKTRGLLVETAGGRRIDVIVGSPSSGLTFAPELRVHGAVWQREHRA